MRLISGAILTSLLLTGAGCMRSEPTFEPEIIPPPPKQESINPAGEVKIESAGFKKSFRLNEFASCDIDITYPSFPAGELDEIQQLQIEHEMSHYIALVLGSSAEIDAPSELETLGEAYIANCQNEVTTEYNDLQSSGEELFTNLQHYIDLSFNVTLNENKLLSFTLNESSYEGGAHPNYNSIAINADRESGELIRLEFAFTPEHMADLMALEKTKLLAEHGEDLYPDILDERQTISFYLTPTALVTFYSPYEIAPYAAGPIEVELPYSEIKEFINPDGPLAAVLK